MQSEPGRGRTAVVVIDMLNDFVTGPLGCDRAERIVPRLGSLLDRARAKGVPVIYLCDAHRKGVDRELDLWGDHAIAGTAGADVIPELAPRPGDHVVRKRRYSGFHGTDLDMLLRELRVDRLVITGMQAHICVRHTAADAFFRGYGVTVPSDGIEAFTDEILQKELAYLKEMYGAEISTADRIAEGFRSPSQRSLSATPYRDAWTDASRPSDSTWTERS